MKVCSIADCGRSTVGRGLCNRHYKRLTLKGSAAWEPPTPQQRFWAKVDKTEECWEWTASKFETGYGKFWDGRKAKYAHRYALELAGVDIEGKEVDHICHNRLCVNPLHLVPGDRKANAENHAGPNRNNKSGYRGVSYYKPRGTWRAQVTHNRKLVHSSYHKTPEEAAEAAAEARIKYHKSNYADRN